MAGSPYLFEYQGSFRLDAPPHRVWASIEQVDRYPGWWGWLREFGVDGRGLEPGSVLRGVVVPPLPYAIRVQVALQECEPARRIEASVHGDLEGHAVLVLEPEGPGTRAAVAWALEVMQRPMRAAARVAHPLLRWGHDRVVDATVAGFRRHLAAEEGAGV